ncbi:hypothetical protein V2J09_017175 [Rumex salicifolius]
MAIIQSLTVPRFPSASLAPIAASSLSPLPATVKSASLPAFTGLRIRSGTSIRYLRSARSVARRAGRVVCESPDTATEVPAVTDSSWQSLVLDSETPSLVEFWAPWCGPCRMIHPIIDELAKEYAGKLKCFKVNTDESPSIATRYGIRSIPTVLIFKKGEKKDSVIGAVPKSTLTTSIEKFLPFIPIICS